jgi:hypothetical protein
VALELERLRRALEVGLARIDGALALLAQRHDQTDKTLAEHEQRLDAIERGRWPLPSIAAVVSVAALGLTVYESVSR